MRVLFQVDDDDGSTAQLRAVGLARELRRRLSPLRVLFLINTESTAPLENAGLSFVRGAAGEREPGEAAVHRSMMAEIAAEFRPNLFVHHGEPGDSVLAGQNAAGVATVLLASLDAESSMRRLFADPELDRFQLVVVPDYESLLDNGAFTGDFVDRVRCDPRFLFTGPILPEIDHYRECVALRAAHAVPESTPVIHVAGPARIRQASDPWDTARSALIQDWAPGVVIEGDARLGYRLRRGTEAVTLGEASTGAVLALSTVVVLRAGDPLLIRALWQCKPAIAAYATETAPAYVEALAARRAIRAVRLDSGSSLLRVVRKLISSPEERKALQDRIGELSIEAGNRLATERILALTGRPAGPGREPSDPDDLPDSEPQR